MERDLLNKWLEAAKAARPLCDNPEVFDQRIAEQETRLERVEYDLADQWALSNGLHVVMP